jgi:hypothetical protein
VIKGRITSALFPFVKQENKIRRGSYNASMTILPSKKLKTPLNPQPLGFSRFQFPIVRQVSFPSIGGDNETLTKAIIAKKLGLFFKSEKLSANNIVSVQPMTLPAANIFYIDSFYGSRKKTRRKNENNPNCSYDHKKRHRKK